MKKLLATIVAIIVGSFLFFFRKKSEKSQIEPKIKELDKKAEAIKSEIKDLEKNQGKPVEDKTLQDELDYWKKR